jgi:hypothetical protein
MRKGKSEEKTTLGGAILILLVKAGVWCITLPFRLLWGATKRL